MSLDLLQKFPKFFNKLEIFKYFSLLGAALISKNIISNTSSIVKRLNLCLISRSFHSKPNDSGWVIFTDGCQEHVNEVVFELFRLHKNLKFLLIGDDDNKLRYNCEIIKNNLKNNVFVEYMLDCELEKFTKLILNEYLPISYVILNSDKLLVKSYVKLSDDEIRRILSIKIFRNKKILYHIEKLISSDIYSFKSQKVLLVYLDTFETKLKLPYLNLDSGCRIHIKTYIQSERYKKIFNICLIDDFNYRNANFVQQCNFQNKRLVEAILNNNKSSYLFFSNNLLYIAYKLNYYLKSQIQKAIISNLYLKNKKIGNYFKN